MPNSSLSAYCPQFYCTERKMQELSLNSFFALDVSELSWLLMLAVPRHVLLICQHRFGKLPSAFLAADPDSADGVRPSIAKAQAPMEA